ncbi:MAG: glycosyl transferase group 1 [Gemmatimonadetes bacterium]|nr:glycosyl transferase group 1 [Gemmatimonadota bacterium]
MRIAFIHNLPSGGGKRSAFEFVKHLTKAHSVDLYHIDPASEDYLDLRPLVERSILVEGPSPKGGLGVLTTILPARNAYRKVADQVNAGRYDLAFVMQCKLTNSPAVLTQLQIPSLYFCHEPLARTLEPHFHRHASHRRLKSAVIQFKVGIDRANARGATLICANSRYSAENIYRSYGVYPRYSKLGVDSDCFRPLGLPRGEPFVLSVGQLHPAKAQDLIIEAVATTTGRPRIVFIHNSSAKGYRAYLQELADRRGVTVSFEQLVDDDALVNAYNRAAVVAFPSHLEPLGFVPLEAMACGTPVVGIAEGGIRETVQDGITGLLTDRHPVDFGQAIDVLLSDDALRARMGVAGREYVAEHWSWAESSKMLDANLEVAMQRGRINDISTTSKR